MVVYQTKKLQQSYKIFIKKKLKFENKNNMMS